LSKHELENCLALFTRLKPETARQVLKFQFRNAGRPSGG